MEIGKRYQGYPQALSSSLETFSSTSFTSYTFLCGPMGKATQCYAAISGGGEGTGRRKECLDADFKQKLTEVKANVTKTQRNEEECLSLSQASDFRLP